MGRTDGGSKPDQADSGPRPAAVTFVTRLSVPEAGASRDAGDRAGFAGVVGALRRVEEHETIAEGVLRDGEPADRDVHGFDEHPPAVSGKDLGGGIGGSDLPVSRSGTRNRYCVHVLKQRFHELRMSAWTLQEPPVERREYQDDSDVDYQPLPGVVPEEQDVHADHDGYHREHVKHDGCLSSHRLVLLRARQRSKGGWFQ